MHLIQQFCNELECNSPHGYKGKGNIQDLSNWRGICLKEIAAKIVSMMIASHLLSNPTTQPIWSYCMPRGPSYAQVYPNPLKKLCIQAFTLFVDLATKAFDAVNHELLLKMLAKLGEPPKLIKATQKMYMSCIIRVEAGREKVRSAQKEFSKETTSPHCFYYLSFLQPPTHLKGNCQKKKSYTDIWRNRMGDSLAKTLYMQLMQPFGSLLRGSNTFQCNLACIKFLDKNTCLLTYLLTCRCW